MKSAKISTINRTIVAAGSGSSSGSGDDTDGLLNGVKLPDGTFRVSINVLTEDAELKYRFIGTDDDYMTILPGQAHNPVVLPEGYKLHPDQQGLDFANVGEVDVEVDIIATYYA